MEYKKIGKKLVIGCIVALLVISPIAMIVSAEIANSTYVQSFGVSDSTPRGVTFNDNGTKMYTIGDDDAVDEYSLSTAFDISTASSSQSLSVASEFLSPSDIQFNNDGSKMFIIGASEDKVAEYSLSTPFDVSTASLTRSFSVLSETGFPSGLTFNNDGSKMYVMDRNDGIIYQYSLSTPFNIGTASLSKSFNQGQNGNPWSLRFNEDGSKMFYAGDGNGDSIYEYDLSTPFDISTLTYVEKFDVSAQEANPQGLEFNNDGTQAFIIGPSSDQVHEYSTDISGYSSNVSGYVKDSNGIGLADASVEFRDGLGNVVKATTTNSTGFYKVQIEDGTYEINATKTGYTSDNVTYNVEGDGTVNDLIIEAQADVTGYVTDLSGKKVENANATLYEDGVKIESKLTNRNGKFKFNTTNGDYRIEITKKLHAPYSENFSVSGDTDLGKIRIEKKDYDLTLGMSKYMNYSDIQEIVVRFNNDDVTSNATITITDTYANYELITYYANNHSLVATHNESLYGEINVNASYDAGDKIVYVDENVTVSPVEMKHVEILSPLFATLSIVGNQRMQYIFFVIIVGVGATIITTRSGGMGLMIISLIGGWLAGFIGLGVVLASLFAGIFIMMNTQDTLRYGRG